MDKRNINRMLAFGDPGDTDQTRTYSSDHPLWHW